MAKLNVDFNKAVGKIKPMNCVNNGPCGSRGRGNFDIFTELRFPYARTHDTALTTSYGQKVVDIHRIFDNFDSDENNPDSYDFTLTDKFIADTYSVGTKIFYRLGASIEHEIKKYGTIPPKDYLKWAKICEHIIMHYNYGWADGFNYGIEYWEIWNEVDCINSDGTNSCWQGTKEEFFEFFVVVFKYLKGKFPSLKIGGPAMTSTNSTEYWHPFLTYLKENNTELDFYSYHGYLHSVNDYFTNSVAAMEKMLAEHGLKRTEIILNEWNYNGGWSGHAFTESIETIKNHKGASFTLAMMLAMQHTSLDMLMYYDARLSAYNGFCDTYTYRKLKGYESFLIFADLRELGTEALSSSDDNDVFICAAEGNDGKAVAVTYYDDNSEAEDKLTALELDGIAPGAKAEIYLSNGEYDMRLMRSDYISTGHTELYFNLKNYDRLYIKIKE